MKNLIFISAILISSQSFAKAYKVVNHLQFGKHECSSTLILEEGKQGTITSTKEETGIGCLTKVLVTPIKKSGGQIRLNFEIAQIKDGKTTSLGKPEVIALLGETASIEAGKTGQLPDFKLSTVVSEAK